VRDFYQRKILVELIKEIHSRYNHREYLSKKELIDSVLLIFNKTGLPLPSHLLKYFAQSGLINQLISDIHNSHFLDVKDREGLREIFGAVLRLYPIKNSGEELRFRILGNKGIYSINEIKRNKVWFNNYGSRPNLITINSIETENQYVNDSWLYWVSRRELKFATSVILSSRYNNFFPYFNPYDTISLNYSYVKEIPDNLIFEFLNQWLDIKNYFIKADGDIFNREPRPDLATYRFDQFEPKNNGFQDLFDAYSIRDHLLMRTSNYLLKALMNNQNLLFQEEALLNAFFALEGSLHLLQRKYGDHSPKLNRLLLRKVFKEEILYLPHGEGTWEFIESGYFTRISLVHPEPKWGAEWNPYVHISDFREYFGLAKMIMNWTLAERELDWW
jgi:hypothetical protein